MCIVCIVITAFNKCSLRDLQSEVCGSISKFMAFVHKSVNDMSQQYLVNERRYNYTTPKSFLELVFVYYVHVCTCTYVCMYVLKFSVACVFM